MCQQYQKLPDYLYSSEDIEKAELMMVQSNKIDLYDLVELAGEACFSLLKQLKCLSERVLVLAGSGNNGADAFVVARKLVEANISCLVLHYVSNNMTNEVTIAKNHFLKVGGKVQNLCLTTLNSELDKANVLIDGLMGIGFKGQLREFMFDVIDLINSYQNSASAHNENLPWILSLDTPSGLHVNTGNCDPIAIKAQATLCFGGLKQGLFTSIARNHVGKVYFADLGLSPFLPESHTFLKNGNYLRGLFVRRPANSHKGDFGKVLVIGGDLGMAGAIRLSSEACLRVGAGLVAVASHSQHQIIINNGRSELMFCAVDSSVINNNENSNFLARLAWASTLVVGPGFGTSNWSKAIFEQVLKFKIPCVLDADALNLLALKPMSRQHWVLTPHPGEAARLLNCTVQNIESNRFDAVKALQRKYGGVVLLKGAGTLVYDGKRLIVAPVGNPGLASGGCGDVLSGIIGGLIAQGFDLMKAAVAGCIIHGEAADLAVENGERGMLASDLMPFIRELVN